ncbi:hypothetical protein GCM10029976_080100 [Kribbella albertanoniae]|uniref:Uncharacterized protein n=1 Tax=Kribbella albertanoniae TaxID=1266829 RepID=A0A4V2XQA1_9ACTN|nr:hypothetical protein [Kribbella albertanoniae]TDC25115.1 hypothetical protein E1261_24760 [Kribbella albertanoniae]
MNEGYARLYAPLAVVAMVLSFQPILPADEYGTVWEMAGRGSGNPAAMGAVLMGGLIALLGYASFRRQVTAWIPVAIAVLSGLIAVMLLTRPGTGSPRPELTSFGDAALAVAICTCLLAVSQLVRLRRR